MRAAIRREYRDAFVVVVVMRVRIHDRPSGFRIDTFGPIHLSKRLSRDECSSDAIQNVIETVLVRLHDDFSVSAINCDVREHETLHAVIIPRIAGCVLVVPLQLTRVGLDREY